MGGIRVNDAAPDAAGRAGRMTAPGEGGPPGETPRAAREQRGGQPAGPRDPAPGDGGEVGLLRLEPCGFESRRASLSTSTMPSFVILPKSALTPAGERPTRNLGAGRPWTGARGPLLRPSFKNRRRRTRDGSKHDDQHGEGSRWSNRAASAHSHRGPLGPFPRVESHRRLVVSSFRGRADQRAS